MSPRPEERKRASLSMRALLALGVVYGDIGTSPLYALKETFNPSHGIALDAGSILGGVSAIFWTLMIIVTLKYVTLVLRANNRGEGGIMALLALATASVKQHPRWIGPLLAIGVFGASLFYGDAVLTPAISVLSAVEGLQVGTAAFAPFVVPIATAILVALFLIQKRGTRTVGLLFGPVCALWFASIALAGTWNIARNPAILAALNPLHAVAFITGHGFASFLVLGSVLLAVTGAEALYADMGHFGKAAVRLSWYTIVAPSLVLNYFGQGALLLADMKALENPFFLAFPSWALYPMVSLATLATIIASQATISGAYSMTQQAIQLGYLPRMNIAHTSAETIGQIYVPAVNWMLLVAVALAVVGFGSSTALASAYGIAVMGTMLVTTFLTFFVIRFGWRYPAGFALLATGFFLLVDGAFFAAALHKVGEGGWFPLVLGALVFLLMATWHRGRWLLRERLRADSVPLDALLKSIFVAPPPRVPGTAIYLTAQPDVAPSALLHGLRHYKVLHERAVFLTVQFRDVPWVRAEDRLQCEPLGDGCWRVRVRYGFMDRPNLMPALDMCVRQGLEIDPMQSSFFLSREKIVPTAGKRRMAPWREHLFATMTRNAGSVTDYFNIPTNSVIELGTRIAI